MKMKPYNFLLVNYSGSPDYMEYLYVDNGLAYLAGLLTQQGHGCEVMDYMTLGTSERLFPYEYAEKSDVLRQIAMNQIVEKGTIFEDLLCEIREHESLIDVRNRRVAQEIVGEIRDKIIATDAKAVGFKLWSQPSLKDTLYIAKSIKEMFPDVVLFAGGAHMDYFLEKAYADHLRGIFDFSVYSEGEPALEKLGEYVDGKIGLESIPNIIYEKDGQIMRSSDIRKMGLPLDYNMNFDPNVYPAVASLDEKVKLIPIENTRGCNFNCGFCIHPIKSGRYREKTLDSFFDEMYALNEKYGFINFYACGSNTSHENCISILQKMYNRGNDLVLSFFQSTRDFDFNNIGLLERANVGFFWIGIETASSQLSREIIHNGKDISKSEAVCLALNDIGVRHYDSYIFPMPGNDFMKAQETLDLIHRINAEWVVLYPPLLQPRTAWGEKGNDFIQFVDKEGYIRASMFGIEEYENKVLPPILTNRTLGEAVSINGKTYRDIFCEYLQFRHSYDRNNLVSAHNYHPKKLDLTKDMNVFYTQHDEMTAAIMEALKTGNFKGARSALAKYNEICTAGSIKKVHGIMMRGNNTLCELL